MTCPSEFTCALYADGELEPRQSERLAAHLDVCSRCRTLVAALDAERRLLVSSMREAWEDEPVTEPVFASAGPGLDRMAAGLMGVAMLLRFGLALISSVGAPDGLDWLHPLTLAGRLNWLANSFFYFVGDGGAMITSFISSLSVSVFNVLVLSSSVLLLHRIRPARVVLGLGTVLLAFALPGHAIDVRTAGQGGSVVVAEGETIDDTLVVFGESVLVSGTVTGDLVAFVQRAEIDGTVEGNVLSFAQNVEVGGVVEGDVVAFSQTLRIGGQVGRNLWRLGQSVDVDDTGRIGGDAVIFGASTNFNGSVERDLTMSGATLDVSGQVGRDVDFRGGQVSVRAPAAVGGSLRARVRQEDDVRVEAGASIGGERSVELQEPGPSDYVRPGYYVMQVIRLGAAFVTALLLFWLFPRLGRVDLNTAGALLISGGIGFLAVVATPIAALFVALTLVGLPLAVSAIGLWLLGLYLSKIMVAQFLGRTLIGSGANETSTVLGLLAGLVMIILAVNLPYVGGIINFLLTLIGFGALLTTAYRISGWGGSDGLGMSQAG